MKGRKISAKSVKSKYKLTKTQKTRVESKSARGTSEIEENTEDDNFNVVDIAEYERQKREIERLRKLTQTMQHQTNKVITLAREGRIDAFDDSFKTTVMVLTKKEIYPICQYISNSEQLDKCMRILARQLQLNEQSSLGFCVNYKHAVNSAIASRRNADVQLIRKELKGMCGIFFNSLLTSFINKIVLFHR